MPRLAGGPAGAGVSGTRSLDPLGWALLRKPNDGKVSVASTRLAGSAHLVIPATNTFIMRHPAAVEAMVAFLVAKIDKTR